MSIDGVPIPPPSLLTSTSNFVSLQTLSQDKLTGPNYLDWIRSLSITLSYEKKEYVLDEYLPEGPFEHVTAEEFVDYTRHHKNSIEVAYIMLVTMVLKL